MHNIYDIGQRCNKKIFIFNTQLKIVYEKCKYKIIDQHMNATCQMQSFEKNYNLGTFGSFYYVELKIVLIVSMIMGGALLMSLRCHSGVQGGNFTKVDFNSF